VTACGNGFVIAVRQELSQPRSALLCVLLCGDTLVEAVAVLERFRMLITRP
jgi:hypothetical protein